MKDEQGSLHIEDDEKTDLVRILLFGLHLQAMEAGNSDGFASRVLIPKEIWDTLYDGELLFSVLSNADGDMVITTQVNLKGDYETDDF